MRFSGGRGTRRFVKNRGALVGLAIVTSLVLFAVVAPLVATNDPYTSDFDHGTLGQGPSPPDAHFLLGEDILFRDLFVRLAYGARLSLLIAISATVIASGIGAVIGIVAGYYEGTAGVRVPWPLVVGAVAFVAGLSAGRLEWGAGALAACAAAAAMGWFARIERLRAGPRINLDTVLMRVVDIGLSFPFLLLVMAIGAALDRTSATTILVTLGVTGWLGIARLLRAKTLQVKNLDFVVASRALGQRTLPVLARHVLPNVAGPLIVVATISVAQMIVAESVLSYLGVGISPPTPTWGHMLLEGQDFYQAAPWLLLVPASAILLAVFGFNLLGEGLRDALDPQED